MDPFASTFVLCGVRSAGRLAWERDSAAGFCRWRAGTGQFTCATARPRGCGICRELPFFCKMRSSTVVACRNAIASAQFPCSNEKKFLTQVRLFGPRARSPRYPAGATCAGGGFLRRVVRRGDCTTCQGVVRRGDCTTCQGERSSSSGARVAPSVFMHYSEPAQLRHWRSRTATADSNAAARTRRFRHSR